MARIDLDCARKLFSFILMGISGLWANFLVRESIVKYSTSRVWKNLAGNLSLFCWVCTAAAVYYAWKNRDLSVFFRTLAFMFITISLIIPLMASFSCLEYTIFSVILFYLTIKSRPLSRAQRQARSAQESAGPVILTASTKKCWSLMGLIRAISIKRASSKNLFTGFIFMDLSILNTWQRAEKLFKEIRCISKRVNSRFELSNHENTCLYLDRLKRDFATHLVRIQHLYDFKRKNSRGPEKKSLLKMEKKIKTSIEKTITGLESMKARALIMEIGSISGLQKDTDCLNSSLELADQAFKGLSLARLELDLEFDLDKQEVF